MNVLTPKYLQNTSLYVTRVISKRKQSGRTMLPHEADRPSHNRFYRCYLTNSSQLQGFIGIPSGSCKFHSMQVACKAAMITRGRGASSIGVPLGDRAGYRFERVLIEACRITLCGGISPTRTQ